MRHPILPRRVHRPCAFWRAHYPCRVRPKFHWRLAKWSPRPRRRWAWKLCLLGNRDVGYLRWRWRQQLRGDWKEARFAARTKVSTIRDKKVIITTKKTRNEVFWIGNRFRTHRCDGKPKNRRENVFQKTLIDGLFTREHDIIGTVENVEFTSSKNWNKQWEDCQVVCWLGRQKKTL